MTTTFETIPAQFSPETEFAIPMREEERIEVPRTSQRYSAAAAAQEIPYRGIPDSALHD